MLFSAVSVKSDSCVGRSERREKFDSKTNRDWCSESQLLSKGDEKKAKISSDNSKKPFSISLGVLPKSSSSKSFGSFLKVHKYKSQSECWSSLKFMKFNGQSSPFIAFQ